MDLSDAKRLKQPEAENATLKRLVTDVPDEGTEDQDGIIVRSAWDGMYADSVHPSDYLGNYVLQVTAAAVLWNIDPKAVPNSYSTLTVSQAHGAYVRCVISDVVKGYQRAGVDTAGWT